MLGRLDHRSATGLFGDAMSSIAAHPLQKLTKPKEELEGNSQRNKPRAVP